jgi:hypothetical protein
VAGAHVAVAMGVRRVPLSRCRAIFAVKIIEAELEASIQLETDSVSL